MASGSAATSFIAALSTMFEGGSKISSGRNGCVQSDILDTGATETFASLNLAIFSAKRFSVQTAHAASKSARDETANVPPNSFSSAAE